MARNLKTGWVVLATSGSVIHGAEDGRIVEKQWLTDMAETYNAKIHTAKIWPDHKRYWNGGKVLALKVEPAKEEELKGEIQLYGILAPNDALIHANRQGEYTHPSIEVGDNYRGTGKYFLRGLGLVDEPASAAVTELHFSAKSGEQKTALIFPGHQINVAESLQEEKGLFSRIFSKEIQQEKNETQQQDNNMAFDDAQKSELREIIATEMSKAFSKLNPNPSHTHTLSTDNMPAHTHRKEEFTSQPTGNQGETKPEGGVSEETVPMKEFKKLEGKFEDLKTQFKAALTQEQPGTQAPEGTGGAEPERVL